MYLVRETFIAKPGYAGEFAEITKKEMASMKDFKGYVLLDMVTDYNKIVVEYEIESLAAFEQMMTQMKNDSKKKNGAKKPKPHRYTEIYQTGKREIFRIL